MIKLRTILFQGNVTMFCLYLPDEITKNIVSVKIKLHPKGTIDRHLIKRDTLWRVSLSSSEIENHDLYSYKLKFKKFGFSHTFFESKNKPIPVGINKRDIISSLTNNESKDDMQMGLLAHIKDILLHEPINSTENVLHEFDNLIIRESLKDNCEGAFEHLFCEDITSKLCLLLIHSMKKKYVRRSVLIKADIASKVWKELQNVDQETRNICGQYVKEILHVYDATDTTRRSPLHYITDMQSVLDISMLHTALILEPQNRTIHRCDKSSPCLRNALQLILEHVNERGKFMDLIRIIIESINENEVLEACSILKGLDVPEKNMELKESGQEVVLGNIANLLTKHVTTLSYEKINDIVSKVEDDERSILILHCEKKILDIIKDSFYLLNIASAWKFLKYVANDKKLFQTTAKQVLLLDTALKRKPHSERRYFITHVLMNVQNTESESATETFKRAYHELFAPIQRLSSDADLLLCFQEYNVLSKTVFFQKNEKEFEGRLKKHISKYTLLEMLEIHRAVESLHPETVDLYCAYLNGKLRYENPSAVNDVIQANWKRVDTR